MRRLFCRGAHRRHAAPAAVARRGRHSVAGALCHRLPRALHAAAGGCVLACLCRPGWGHVSGCFDLLHSQARAATVRLGPRAKPLCCVACTPKHALRLRSRMTAVHCHMRCLRLTGSPSCLTPRAAWRVPRLLPRPAAVHPATQAHSRFLSPLPVAFLLPCRRVPWLLPRPGAVHPGPQAHLERGGPAGGGAAGGRGAREGHGRKRAATCGGQGYCQCRRLSACRRARKQLALLLIWSAIRRMLPPSPLSPLQTPNFVSFC